MTRKMVVAAAALLLSACAHQDAARRADYWRSETNRHVPPGSPLAVAEAFFAQRGLQLVCCVDQLDGTKPRRYALECDVSPSLFMRYDVAILVETTPEERVSAVTVQQWGIGL